MNNLLEVMKMAQSHFTSEIPKMDCGIHDTSSQGGCFFNKWAISLPISALVVFVFYRISLYLCHILWRHFTVSAHITGGAVNYFSQDKSYHMLLAWIGENVKTFPHFSINLKTKPSNSRIEETDLWIVPSFGIHYFQYKGHWIQLTRKQTPAVRCNSISWESITLTTYRGNKELLNTLMTEAKNLMKNDDEDKTVFHCIACGEWQEFGEPKVRRQFDSVILKEGEKEKLYDDILEFIDSEDWYRQRGIPYRRGYMLYGPPGCGKSSFIKAVAGEIGYDICMLSLSVKDLSDDALNQLMNSAPEKSIILLEDIDAAFKSRECEGSSSKETSLAFEGAGASKVTFRGLLNALDGVASTEGRIIFMTTNYIERLDPALVRPGRVDVKVLVDLPNNDQLERMFSRFYPEVKSDAELKRNFVKTIRDLKKDVSMAMVQGLFMKNKRSAQSSIENAQKYFEEQYFSVAKKTDKVDDTQTNK